MNNVSFSDPEYTNKVPSSISEPSQLSGILTTSQVLLVVNLASFWGYTPQYYALNALTERVLPISLCSNQSEINEVFFQYADRPFKILGFPCNQFLRQVLKLFSV